MIDDIDGLVAVGMTYDWAAEQLGSLLVTGDGPWFVSVAENWQDSSSLLEGQANYTVIEVDGELEIVNHYWAGFKTPLSE